MNERLPTRCAHPTVGPKRASTYTVLGFMGYGVASVVGAVVMSLWHLPLEERLVAMLVPPVAFLLVVTANKRVLHQERIVFYQTAIAGVVSVAVVGVALDAHVARLVDVAVLGIGIFLVFGRIGCFSVACCHGRPGRFGVVYGPEHVRVGFWSRWVGRPLWPVQLVESVVSLVLVIVGLVIGWHVPGLPALAYIVGYGCIRFGLELLRGDAARPHALGISEAQWTATATLVATAVWRPSVLTIASASLLIAGIAVLAARHKRRQLTQSPHLVELDRACTALLASHSEEKRETSLGISVSCHRLPDGRRDWVLSSSHPAWSMHVARRLAADLWSRSEFVEGRIAGIAHVIEAG